ncbi:FeoB-associated Cys-rich membrane protein [Clostridium sp.]|uniref:FeoB-associated Cys-rich membrane protein n=1 Tax=Clostridium sp. TaxID=1506 RepID=UPI0025BCDDBD|nr:FeoB-associated Cys-rich membrane protein [Clostridium sp.]
MEYIIVGVIVIVAVYLLYSNIKRQASGDCGSGCKNCSHSCNSKPSSNKDKKDEQMKK